MKWFRQLKLLLWKNYRLKLRQKGRVILEIALPLVLFTVLSLVRLRGLKAYNHQCHFDEKAMPSVGFKAFTRNAICTYPNSCNEFSEPVFPTLFSSYNKSFKSQLIDDVEDSLYHSFDKDHVSTFSRIIDDITTLQKISQKVKKHFVQGNPVQGMRITRLGEIFLDEESFVKEVREWSKNRNIDIKTSLIKTLLSASISSAKLEPWRFLWILGNPTSIFCNKEIASQLINIPGTNYMSLEPKLQPLCTMNVSSLRSLTNLIQRNLNMNAIQKEFDEFTQAFGEYDQLKISEWITLVNIGHELQHNLIEKRSIIKLYGDLLYLFHEYNYTTVNKFSDSEFDQPSLLEHAFDTLNGLRRVMCQKKTAPALELFLKTDGMKRFKAFQTEEESEDEEDYIYVYDESTTPECNMFMKSMEDVRIASSLWKIMKPFIRGKILYTPVTPATEKLAQKMNETFMPINNIKASASNWTQNLSKKFRSFFLQKENQAFLKDLFTEDTEGNLLDIIFDDRLMNVLKENGKPVINSSHVRDQMKSYFEGDFSTRWNTTLYLIDKTTHGMSLLLSCFESEKFVGIKSERDLEKKGMNMIRNDTLWAGLVFVDLLNNKSDILPEFITYKIRIDSAKVDSTLAVEDLFQRPGPRHNPTTQLKYITFGFAYLQDMVEHAIISIHSGRPLKDLPGITLKQMPYPCYIEDQFVHTISSTIPLFMITSWIYSAAMMIKSIVYEKEKRLKETMKTMGLSNGILWLSWFIDSFCSMFISCILLTIILFVGEILEYADPSLILFFLVSYSISAIMLCFLMSTFFSKSNVATAGGGILFFCLHFPYPFLLSWENYISTYTKIFSSLINNVAFGFGCRYFAHYEESAIGVRWSNLWSSSSVNDKYSLGGAIAMLWVDSLIYGILTWYIDTVCPGEYGVPKPWYFLFTKSYWTGKKMRSVGDSTEEKSDYQLKRKKNKYIEKEPKHLPLGVSIQNLRKVYPNGKVAIEDLSLNFYEGQITSFLGHNGAGKTTTISILVGLYPPTEGTAKINGLDIRTDIDSIRSSLGMCPQHNVLFDELTVYEHLWLFSILKQSKTEDINKEIEEMLQDLGLSQKRNERVKKLSGGMQRKLSVALAFVGGSRTVVLDEPTAGVDPYSRRSIWDLLIKYKKDRTLILTTHFMDEADLLGDRIAIINKGKLITCGSSLFLRHRFGNRYYLTLDKYESEDNKNNTKTEKEDKDTKSIIEPVMSSNINNDMYIDDEGISDVSKVNGVVINPSMANKNALNLQLTKFIQRHVPGAELLEQVGSEVIYILPTDNYDKSTKRFEALFADLDKHLKQLRVQSYGLSNTTLEEIFLKVANTNDDNEIKRLDVNEGESEGRRRLKSTGSGISRTLDDHLDETVEEVVKDVIENSDTSDEATYTHIDIEGKNDVTNNDLRKSVKNKSTRKDTTLFIRHVGALLIKRFHHSRRDKKGMIAEIILPAFFICVAMLTTMLLPPRKELPPLSLSPWIYPTTKDYYTSTFFANSHIEGDWTNRYLKQLLSKTGMGTKCVAGQTSEKKCSGLPTNTIRWKYDGFIDYDKFSPNCDCKIGTQQCGYTDSRFYALTAVMPSGDIIGNLTNRNISDYLLKTRKKFYKRRYGGFELGIWNPLANQNFSLMSSVIDRWSKATNLGKPRIDPFVLEYGESIVRDAAYSSSAFDNIRVWFNNEGWAASVSYMNAINNVILRASMKEKSEKFESIWEDNIRINVSKYGIEAINHPMNFTEGQLDTEVARQVAVSLLHAICVIFAMSFVPASFLIFHVDEKITKARHLQFVSGVKPFTYWITAFLWDIGMYTITAFLCVLIFIAFDATAYVSEKNLPGFIILILLYGWAAIPLMYPLSLFFTVPSTAFVTCACGNLFIGIITTATSFVLESFQDDKLQTINDSLSHIFILLPQFCLGRGLMDIAKQANFTKIMRQYMLVIDRSLFDWDFLGQFFASLFIQGIVFFCLIMVVEMKLFRRFRALLKKDHDISRNQDELNEKEDHDVQREFKRVMKFSKTKYLDNIAVLVKNLVKRYPGRKTLSVNHLSFTVKRGECFGLLGVNGAGKTTTFKMLTGDIEPTSGEGFINGFNILTEMAKCQQSLGYCPQFDALDPLLTGREHLRFYARLRGLSEHEVKRVAEWGLKKLGLLPFANICAGTYSGGNKRKLSTAIALIGKPSVVFLDEPTSGMDPGSRRFVWNCILDIIREGQSVILTSHSMEECEALCTRLGIMVNGKFECIGSAQHLKSRFGSGYTLTLRCGKCDDKSIELLKRYVLKEFPDAELKEMHYNQLNFQLPIKKTKLHHVFGIMETAKLSELIDLEDYSVTQTTLDEVFVRFARHQRETKEREEDTKLNHVV